MKRFLLFCTAIFFAFSAQAFETYTIDSEHTNISWSINHFGFSNLSGKFPESSGTITIDQNSPANSSVEIAIRTTSLQTGFSALNNELLNANFLNAAKFPEAKFVSTQVIPQRNFAKVTGDFTFLGVTQPITLNVKLNKIGINPLTQKKTIGFSASGTFKRSDFGMTFGAPDISDIIKLNIETEAVLGSKTQSSVATNQNNTSNNIRNAERPWKISPESKIEFTATQGNAAVTGSFKKFDGNIIFESRQPQLSKASIDIDVTSVSTSVADAVGILQSSDWFSFAQFPKANFTAIEFIPSLANQYMVRGNLTIKGKTVPINLKLIFHSYSDNEATATGTTTIRRSDFGIGNSDPKKSNNIGDDVKIKFTLKATRS